ncbi:MAG TPA: AbgT family transporter, partial [Aminobacteriaceae bacterium]|nr:AbgT family transporter [Aminobacteriaceae bacterium]
MENNQQPRKRGIFESFIKGIEIVGNWLPHPFWLFVLLSLIVVGLSYYLGNEGVAVKYMAAKAGEAPKEVTVAVENLLSFKYMRGFMADFVKTYVNFAPLGLIVVMTLGIGLVERSGMI